MSMIDQCNRFLKKVLRQNPIIFQIARTLNETVSAATSDVIEILGINKFIPVRRSRVVVKEISQFDNLLQTIEKDCGSRIELLGSRLNEIHFDLEAARDLSRLDPFSDRYRDQVFKMHQSIAGNPYDVQSEGLKLENILERARWQTPYGQSAEVVGSYLLGFGFLIKKMNLPLGSRILEIGCGEGSLSYHFAKMGYHLTCVEVSKSFSEITKAAISPLITENQNIEFINQDIFEANLKGEFDAIVFYESFHHILRHYPLLQKLKGNLSRNGIVVFGAEPVFRNRTSAVPYPWGLNLSGEGVRAIRKFGWMELGFLNRYFGEMVYRLDFQMQRFKSFDSKWSDVTIASKR